MQPALGEDERFNGFVRALRKLMRPMAAGLQPLQSLRRVALQVFVPGLAADAELFAQLRDRETVALCEDDKSIYLFHVGYVFPGHSAQKCNPSLRIKCYLSCRIEPLVARWIWKIFWLGCRSRQYGGNLPIRIG